MLGEVRSEAITIGYARHGVAGGETVILLHGFPYAPPAYDAVAARLAEAGCDVVVPWMRGFGRTRLASGTPRSGEQAAFGHDLLTLMDGLGIGRALLAGYDWGGRAACIVSALWPERVIGLVSVGSYNIQDIASAASPLAPELEHRLWYQYYLHGARGADGLAADRAGFARLLWRLWSPAWRFEDATFAASATAFDNPDFVPVVLHSYRHRFGLVPGDPAYAATERRLAFRPAIAVPAVTFDGGADGVADPRGTEGHAGHFTGGRRHVVLPGIGHNLPQEAPEPFADAVLSLRRGSA